ncbi:unnamed protein product [Auanema sp. JU1783]|nr:unnamed protein product [Auanema sp. JU1783]
MVDFKELAQACVRQLEASVLESAVERRVKMTNNSQSLLHVASALSILSFVVCVILLGFIIYGLIRRRIPSRKHIVIISRVVADLFTSALIAFCSFFTNKTSASHTIIALFLFISTFSFLQLSLSHVFVIILRQISVTRPYGFKSICSIRRVSFLVALGWLISVLYAAAYAPLTTVILDSNKDDVCSYSGCQRPLLVVCISLICFLIPMLLLLYSAVCWKMRKIAFSEKMHNEPEITKKKLYKFLGYGSHIFLHLLISVLIVVGAGLILRNSSLYSNIRKHIQEDCDVLEYINTVIRLEMIAGGAVLLWLTRIIFDVVIFFLLEYQSIIPCLASANLEPLRENQIVSRSQTLKWQKGCINCPVFNIDNHFHPWDFKN